MRGAATPCCLARTSSSEESSSTASSASTSPLGIALELGPLVLRHLLAASDRLEDVLDVTTVELVCQTANLEERLPRLGRLAGDLHNRLVGKHPFAGQVALLRLGLAPSGEFARDGKLTARKRGDALDPMPALTRIDIVAFQGRQAQRSRGLGTR